MSDHALRFWAKVDIRGERECWEWIAYKNPLGYGHFHLGGSPKKAHRVAYELLVGPIPAGLVIDHLCRNPPCVNPEHLEVVTLGENTRRGNAPLSLRLARERDRARTHCIHGHPFSGDNLSLTPQGYRRCKACNRSSVRRHREKVRDGSH